MSARSKIYLFVDLVTLVMAGLVLLTAGALPAMAFVGILVFYISGVLTGISLGLDL
jgi:hypothetical protein